MSSTSLSLQYLFLQLLSAHCRDALLNNVLVLLVTTVILNCTAKLTKS